ncbi:hypothetical protein EYF80_035335 [Liparis tanakae]|uniref:Uncharacterized protein n=1 Tax=Liparis tanakae TaxID=230148 RepID=A0A4Z2GLQ2_9TELE|nr:hypothetical protein EYF80_035335 [Liparis tanakae]
MLMSSRRDLSPWVGNFGGALEGEGEGTFLMVELVRTSECSSDRPRVSSLRHRAHGEEHRQRAEGPGSERRSPEARPDGGDVAVQAALGPAHVQRQRALQQTAEDLHLVGAGVFGDLKPLDEELEERRRGRERGNDGGGADGRAAGGPTSIQMWCGVTSGGQGTGWLSSDAARGSASTLASENKPIFSSTVICQAPAISRMN